MDNWTIILLYLLLDNSYQVNMHNQHIRNIWFTLYFFQSKNETSYFLVTWDISPHFCLVISIWKKVSSCSCQAIFLNMDFDIRFEWNIWQVLDGNPVHVKALYRRGMAYMSAGDFEEARNDFNKVTWERGCCWCSPLVPSSLV